MNAIFATPSAYRPEKSQHHRRKGEAILRATIECIMRINEQRYFDEPFGRSGYRIELDGDLADHVFLVDGTCSGGRHELNGDETARLIASFLFRAMTTHVAETLLGTLVDLNQGGNQ